MALQINNFTMVLF